MDRIEETKLFRRLHQGPKILVLPNAWDVASARIFEEAGFPAVATSSAAVANALGYPDGQKISRDEMIGMVKRIVDALAVPVTADLEGGYGDPVETARAAVEAGAVGMNFEDSNDDGSLQPMETQVRAIEAIRARYDLVVNARCDVFLENVGEPASRFDHIVERLNAYHKAGADSLFAPGIRDAETIGRLARAVKGPLNILAMADTPSAAELERLGVRRVSVGAWPMRACMGLLQRMAAELRDQGTYSSMTQGAMPSREANGLFVKK